MLTNTLVRITNGNRYCTGTLITPNTVLTCAHFFREEPHNTYVWVAGRRLVYKDIQFFAGTDVALLTLPTSISLDDDAYPELGSAPSPGAPTATVGLGGTHRRDGSYRIRAGRYLFPVPFSTSRDRKTKVRRGGMIFNINSAVKGDSGGPVFVNGKIVGVQSMITDPFNLNLHLATIALVGHLNLR
ncbi:trypsin-like serine peptidase [Corynebacterium lubricantis]|uniref:trypsin-like serine peptidase n=1 Tax=Corynebacterium lubricantis TaxID=541095 RepID=UPI0003767E0D|nr:trypsin-like serine protease [Corynebacterium lubricantis]